MAASRRACSSRPLGRALPGALRPDPLFLDRRPLALLDVLDPVRHLDGQEAQHRLLEAENALERRHGLAKVQIVGGDVAALLELADLVGQLALALVIVEQPDRTLLRSGSRRAGRGAPALLIGDPGLNDESRLVHNAS
jgi:hypothetical protein